MKVSHLVKRAAVTITEGSTVLEAVRKMTEENVGLVVIVGDSPRKAVGVLSERDVMRLIARDGSLNTRVMEVATPNPLTVRASDDVAKAAIAMSEHRVRHLVVVDDEGLLVGVISIRDLLGEKATIEAIVSSYRHEPIPGGD